MSNQVIARPSSGSKQALLKAAILTMSFVQMSTNGIAGADLAANRFIATTNRIKPFPSSR